MASSSEVHALVHSLTASEKRYVRRFALLSGRETSWLKLFDAIDANSNGDEGALRKRLQGDRMLKNLSVAKRYVYDNVLRALRLYGTGRDVDSDLSDSAENYKVLRGKGLHDQAAVVLAQLRANAYENDAYLKVMWSIICEFGAGVNSTEKAAIDHLQHFLGLQKETIGVIENYTHVAGVYFRQRIVLRHRPYARTQKEKNELTNIVDPLLRMPSDAYRSATAYTFAHLALGDYWEAMGQPFQAQPHFDEFLTVEVLDQPVGPFDSLHLAKFTNAMFFRLRNGIVNDIDQLLLELKKRIGSIDTTKTPDTIQVWRYERWLTFSIMLLNAQHREQDALDIIEREAQTVQHLAPFLSKKIHLQLQVAMVRTYFGVSDARSALTLASSIVTSEDPNTAEVDMAQIALLVALYELRDFDALDARLRRAQYHFSKRHHFHQSEQAIVSGLNSLLRCTTAQQRTTAQQKLKKTLAHIFEDHSERAILGAVDLLGWCDGVI